MAVLSSINLKQATLFSFTHNSRTAIVNYLILDSKNNESNRGLDEAYTRYFALYKEAVSNYMKRTGQKVQTREEKMVWEAVVNLNSEHTLADLKKLTDFLYRTYGWQEILTTIHRDEGHVDEVTGKIIINDHAHIIFFMLSKDGIFRFKKRDFGKRQMALLQTQVANILKMKRGVSKLKTKRVRYEHRAYRQHIQEKESLMQDIAIWKYNFELVENNMIREFEMRKQFQKRVDELNSKNKKLLEELEALSYAKATLLYELKQQKKEYAVYSNKLRREIEFLKRSLKNLETKKTDTDGVKIPSILS